MAALFDLDTEQQVNVAGAAGKSVVGEAFDVIAGHLLELPGVRAIREIENLRGRLDAVECQILGAYIGTDGDTRRAEGLAGSTGASKKTRRRKARRANTAKKNPALADKMAAGELSGEHADIIADAAEQTDGAAGVDNDFIDTVAAADADQAARIARDYITKHTDAAKAQSRHDRQRRRRSVSRFVTDDHLDAIMVKGDTESIDAIWNTLVAGANALYTVDGGRDLPGAKHPRTFAQRLYDTLTTHITGRDGGGRGDCAGHRDTGSSDAASEGAQAKSQTGQEPTASKRHTPKAGPTIVVGVTLEKYLGLDPDAAAELIGVGPIADSVLAQYLNADPKTRFATGTQHLALITRDKGCVCCGKHWLHCQAHHLEPWNAPIRGHTDITKLALLCNDCHHKLHADNHTLYRHTNGTWRTRPATPNETPPQPLNPHGE